ncbi:MAG: ATP-binding protein [Candidatus Korarchaeota archaeon]|nr:ATP-binding protein [Thermoproteota archaeon]MCR8462859.1 ATP-binding protein [Thermoproteota archaeon]MCR8470969.1 ATP-binding protein [Thermoproteota archaeon]MCR8471812.1 ATP-binding protein [Thermoproteota archaeon]MCR8473540.1 ATP-binding protein [Thermoproteota archaeon]
MSLDKYLIADKPSEKETYEGDEKEALEIVFIKHELYQRSKQKLSEKLKEPWLDDCVEIGYLVVPKKLSVKVGVGDSARLLWVRPFSEWSTRVRRGFPLLIYDYLHDEYIAGIITMMGYDVAWHELIDRDSPETRDILTSRMIIEGDTEFLDLVPLIGMEPICSLKKLGGSIVKGDVNFAPHIRAPAYLPSQRIVNTIYGIPNEGPAYGAIMFGDDIIQDPKTGETIAYRMRPELLFEHELIIGTTGKGKTAKCKNDIYNFINTFGGSVVVIDTHNEYSMIAEDPIKDDDPIKPSQSDIKIWKDLKLSPQKIDDVLVWIPKQESSSEGGAKEYTLAENANLKFFTIRFAGIPESMLQYYLPALSPQGYYVLPKLAKRFRLMYPSEKQTLERFYRWLENSAFPKEEVSDATREAILRRLAAILGEEIFDLEGTPDINVRELLKPERVNIVRVDTLKSIVARRIITMHIISKIAQVKLSDYDNETPPTMLLIDEAHNYFPRFVYDYNEREWVLRTVSWVERIAREGRKFRLRIEFSTQSPEDLCPSILKTVNTYTIFGLTPLQVKTLKKFMELPTDLTTLLVNLPARQAVVFARSNASIPIRIFVPWALLRHKMTKKE